MKGDSHFTHIMGFPTGFASRLKSWLKEYPWGFQSRRLRQFYKFAGAWRICVYRPKYRPTVDGDDPRTFPIMLDFDTATANFAMTPVSLPGDYNTNGTVDAATTCCGAK